jgi:SAM-dependent methyltransferase
MRVCYLCFSTNNHYVGKNLDFETNIYACDDCGLIQNDFVSRRYLDHYYHHKYRQTRREGISNSYLDFMSQRADSQYAFITRYLPEDQSLQAVIDIGAGAGKLIEVFYPGSTLFAVESDQAMIAHLSKNANICVLSESALFEEGHVGKFDLITMSHVFEHINNPIEYLYQLHKILAPNGHVFLEVPNEMEPVVRHHVKKKKIGIGHLFDYSIETLKLMIAKSRLFDIVGIGSYGVSVFDWMKGAKLNNFEENHDGNGVYIRCMLKRRETCNASNVNSYLDAVLQARYAHQFLLEDSIEQLHRELSGKDQRIRDLSAALARIENKIKDYLVDTA